MQAFIIPNLTEQEVSFGEVPATGSLTERPATKALFTQRSISPQTRDCFISMFAGENAAARVNQDNPAAFLHGIVAGYDTPLANEQRQKMLAKLPIIDSAVKHDCAMVSARRKVYDNGG